MLKDKGKKSMKFKETSFERSKDARNALLYQPIFDKIEPKAENEPRWTIV